MVKVSKTNVVRLLDKAGIKYELVSYDVDEHNLAADAVAHKLGEDIRQVFKTIILKGDRTGYIVCIVPGDKEVDLKKAAKDSGNKSVSPIPMKDLLPVTGYVRGGCSPIGMKKLFPSYIDSSCLDHNAIYISAGIRGLQVKISPADLIDFVPLVVCGIT